MLRFTKAARPDGVDGHFYPNEKRVTVKPSEVPTPIYPEDDGFWDQFSDTMAAVCTAHDGARVSGGVAMALEKHGIRNARDAAKLVHKDWPSDVMLIAAKANITKWRDLLPGVFTDKVVLLNHLIGWAAHAVSPNSFACKWHYMMPRPEEVAGGIARDEIDAPEPIKARLFDMISRDKLIADQRQFTRYPEGSPDHPSHNAMHAAAMGAGATVIAVLADQTDEQRQDTMLTAYNGAHFRATAGVHYPRDNDVGLWIGQETVRRLLPAKLEEFGVPASETQAILDAISTDWLAG